MNKRDRAIAWAQGLLARGVQLAVRNGRVFMQPASAYKQMTDEEVLTLRHCRPEIKNVISFGVPMSTLPALPAPRIEAPAPKVDEPEPELPEHIRRIVNWNKPEERVRRAERATAEMFRQLNKPSRFL